MSSLLHLITPCPQYSVLQTPTALVIRDWHLIALTIFLSGIRDLKTVSLTSTLAELGLDSVTTVEIREILEREFEVYLTLQEIRNLTFASLDELSAVNQCTEVDKRQLEGTRTMLFYGGELIILESKGTGFALLSLSHHEDMKEWRYSSTHS